MQPADRTEASCASGLRLHLFARLRVGLANTDCPRRYLPLIVLQERIKSTKLIDAWLPVVPSKSICWVYVNVQLCVTLARASVWFGRCGVLVPVCVRNWLATVPNPRPLEFRFSSSLSRLAWSVLSPPYSLRHR